ncbi:hypothetical protein NIES80_40340 [Dolichospermum planctonicum]|uniref:Uncharacterized protein n=1 Tax=Dolichospermum planctonicum TaxID=136072 RepID=A0A480AH03_9CYAN|nr:hypothetical protein NIES80_40340 [Dolichospermum planctonicum]
MAVFVTPVRVKVYTRLAGPSSNTLLGDTAKAMLVSSLRIVPVTAAGVPTV